MAISEIPPRDGYTLYPVGHIRSALRSLAEAPRQGSEGAPDVWLEVDPAYARGLSGLVAGDDILVITWLDRADRDVLEVHPRGDLENPLTGVFATRSPHRPNPLGLHRVTVREISGERLRIGPMEAVDGTPVVDIKPVLGDEVLHIYHRARARMAEGSAAFSDEEIAEEVRAALKELLLADAPRAMIPVPSRRSRRRRPPEALE